MHNDKYMAKVTFFSQWKECGWFQVTNQNYDKDKIVVFTLMSLKLCYEI